MAYADSKQADDNPIPKKKVVVLGTGWAGTTFLRNLDSSQYDVQVISPRNYFAFTPLLPSVTCGTVEPRSIVEPIRRILEKVPEKRLNVPPYKYRYKTVETRDVKILELIVVHDRVQDGIGISKSWPVLLYT